MTPTSIGGEKQAFSTVFVTILHFAFPTVCKSCICWLYQRIDGHIIFHSKYSACVISPAYNFF